MSRFNDRSSNFVVTFVFLIGLLGTERVAVAASQTVPPIGGYQSNTIGLKLYPDATKFGQAFCTNKNVLDGKASFDHVTFRLPATAGYPPNVFVWCRASNGTVLSWETAWSEVCPGPNAAPPTGNRGFTCSIPPGVKPPLACPATDFGNPVAFSNGSKHQHESDYVSPSGLEFTRHYNSLRGAWTIESMPQGWRHSYSMRISSNLLAAQLMNLPDVYTWYDGFGLMPAVFAPPANTAELTRADGYRLSFTTADGGLNWQSDSDVQFKLSATKAADGTIVAWQVRTPSDDIETYDSFGRLNSILNRNGYQRTLLYSDPTTPPAIAPGPNLLIDVSDSFGRHLSFRYDAKRRLSAMVDPAGQEYVYTYDDIDNLISVQYPDTLHRTYIYNEPALQPVANGNSNHLLTGISDEITPGVFVRYASFGYDQKARAISTEHANGVDKYMFSYAGNQITDPSGSINTASFTYANGVNLLNSLSQPAGAGCAAATQYVSYDANNNVTRTVDFNGNETRYTFDLTRNLVLTKTEAYQTALTRKTSTQWAPALRLPVSIAQPKQISTMSYDAAGNLLSKTEQATTDASGTLGFNAVVTGPARTWLYTYNSLGQVLTIKSPNAGANFSAVFTYDGNGNLLTSTNALGHTTNYSNYDAHGRAGRVTDPNGLVTDMSYTWRGQLASISIGGEQTSYSYDGAGQLTQVTLPDGSSLHYSYDAARRQTGVSDDLGNRIAYTLDAMGNRTGEQTFDAGGTLARQITRAYDPLNRLKQITGGTQ